MNNYTLNKNEENKDKLKSGIITAIVWSAILLFLFIYKVTEKLPEKQEVVAKMLINFGDNRNGNGIEEPANQEGSLASKATTATEEVSAPKSETKITSEPKPASLPEPKKASSNEKIITGNNAKHTVKSSENSEKKSEKSSTKNSASNKTNSSSSATKNSGSKATTANSTTGNGDGKGNQAIGNLIKGRGTKPGSQGTGTGIGNQGDPLGGDGNGDSKIGIDRKLISYIPGTMGRGGNQPAHSCTASGTIVISYTVDKSGNVVSARRGGGISDPCVVSTSVSWVKKYVKAEKATVSSTGNYKITF